LPTLDELARASSFGVVLGGDATLWGTRAGLC
jgi:hypothetical protein